jgi:hypothetical protein
MLENNINNTGSTIDKKHGIIISIISEGIEKCEGRIGEILSFSSFDVSSVGVGIDLVTNSFDNYKNNHNSN